MMDRLCLVSVAQRTKNLNLTGPSSIQKKFPATKHHVICSAVVLSCCVNENLDRNQLRDFLLSFQRREGLFSGHSRFVVRLGPLSRDYQSQR